MRALSPLFRQHIAPRSIGRLCSKNAGVRWRVEDGCRSAACRAGNHATGWPCGR